MSWHGGILEGCLHIGEVKEKGNNDAISEWLLKLELALEQELKAKEEYNNKDSKRKECKAKIAKISETIARLVPDLISKSKPNYHYSSNSAKEALNSTPSALSTGASAGAADGIWSGYIIPRYETPSPAGTPLMPSH